MVKYNELNPYEKITYIFINIQAIVGILGIIGNILAFCVFSRTGFKKHSYSFYWRIMSICDIIVVLETFDNWANFILDANIQSISAFLCTINEFHTYVASKVSLWILSLISLDRFLVIIYPNRFMLFRRRRFQVTLVVILLLFSILIHLQLPLNHQLISIENTNSSQVSCYLPPNVQNRNYYCIVINIVVFNLIVNSFLHVKLIRAINASKRKLRHRRSWTLRDRKFAAFL